MARSSVTLEQYLWEVLHESGETNQKDELPHGLIYKWIHKDIIASVLALDGIVNGLYKTTGSIAVASKAGHYDASVNHTAAAVAVTGFSGLTPDAWNGGTITHVSSNIFYLAQITDNDATTITISNGTDLPAITGGAVHLVSSNSSASLALSSLSMLNFDEPVWCVLDSNGIPLAKSPPELAQAVQADLSEEYDGKVLWYKQGQTVQFGIGSGGSVTGTLTVGYFERPTEATALTDTIDFPIEYHDIAQKLTVDRILRKVDKINEAAKVLADREKQLNQIIRAGLGNKPRDLKKREALS